MSIVVQGALISSLYALIAVGFTAIYGVGRVENLAHGAILMVTAYVFYILSELMGIPVAVSFIVAVASGIGISLAIYYGLVKRFKGNPTAIFVSTLVLAVVIQYVFLCFFSVQARNVVSLVPGISQIAGLSIQNNLLAIMGVSWACLGSLLWFIRRTQMGRAIRAVAEDTKGAIVSGINIEKANVVTWIWAGGLAAVAGIFFASYTHVVPTMWVFPLVIAFSIVIVGGLGSIEGSIIAAYIIGISETAMMMLISENLRGVFGMSVMIAILVIRPRGLLGKEM